MTKGKPVLKRHFLRSSSSSAPSRFSFYAAIVIIGFLGWNLIKTAHKNSPPAPNQKTAVAKKTQPAPSSRKTAYAVQTSKPIARAMIRPVDKRMPAPTPAPPSDMELEMDSAVFAEMAPRVQHKIPAPAQTTHPTINWSRPTIAFVIDDVGNEIRYDRLLEQLGGKVTYAILPHVRYSRFYAEKSRRTGAEVILHMPLESELGIYPGPGLIKNNMSDDEIRRMVSDDFDSVPNHIGSNNHMGSAGTSNPRVMHIVLEEIRRRHLFYLDSYTSPNSVVVPISHQLGIPVMRRDVFLDNVERPEPIREQINRAAQIAKRAGYAIAIGHYKRFTLETLAEEIPKLEKEGFQIVKLSDLMKRYN